MTNPRHNMRDIYPPTGPEITARSWLTEAPMRMLMNNLHPDVAENPHELVVYGGIGRAARTWEDFDRIVATLRTLEDDETLLVQSGRPVGVFRTHTDAPRVQKDELGIGARDVYHPTERSFSRRTHRSARFICVARWLTIPSGAHARGLGRGAGGELHRRTFQCLAHHTFNLRSIVTPRWISSSRTRRALPPLPNSGRGRHRSQKRRQPKREHRCR